MTGLADDPLELLLKRADEAEEDFAARPDTERADALVVAWTAVVARAMYLHNLGNAFIDRYDAPRIWTT